MADTVFTRNALDGPPAVEQRMDANRLAGGKVVMPEAFDIQEDPGVSWLKALGAGFVSPFGLTEMALRASASENDGNSRRWAADRLKELRGDQPVMAGIGSGAAIGLVSNPVLGLYIAARNAAKYPAFSGVIPLSSYLGGIGPAAPAFGGTIGGSAARVYDNMFPSKKTPRPQGAYPPEGAY